MSIVGRTRFESEDLDSILGRSRLPRMPVGRTSKLRDPDGHSVRLQVAGCKWSAPEETQCGMLWPGLR